MSKGVCSAYNVSMHTLRTILTQASPLPPASCLRPARQESRKYKPPYPPALGCPLPATDPEKRLGSQGPSPRTSGGLFLVRSAGLLRGRILILKLSRLLGVGSGGHMAVEGFRVSVLKGKPGALSVWVAAPPFPEWMWFWVFLECTLNTTIYLKPPP